MSANDAKKAEVIKMLEKFWGVVPDSLKAAGVPRPTFYMWCREDEAFMEKVDEIVKAARKRVVAQLKSKMGKEEMEKVEEYQKMEEEESHDGE